jgi:hypothetical protein
MDGGEPTPKRALEEEIEETPSQANGGTPSNYFNRYKKEER